MSARPYSASSSAACSSASPSSQPRTRLGLRLRIVQSGVTIAPLRRSAQTSSVGSTLSISLYSHCRWIVSPERAASKSACARCAVMPRSGFVPSIHAAASLASRVVRATQACGRAAGFAAVFVFVALMRSS